MIRAALTALAVAALCSGCSCRPTELLPVPTSLRVEPTQVDFGRLVLGQAAVRTVTLENAGKTALDGTWLLSGAGYRFDDSIPSRGEVGSTPVTVVCAPEQVGVFDGALTIQLAGFEPIIVPLSCEAVPVPQCVSSNACRTSSWDVAAGRCVEANVADNTACGQSDVCLVDPRCHAGRCEGPLRDCNDGDPCTVDTCDPRGGCAHLSAVVCPDESPCRVGLCRPGQGCDVTDAVDGTPCGQRRSCTEADVCIAGQCVVRDPPDGFACQGAGPCGGAGTCQQDACVAGPATTLRTSPFAGTPLGDGGPGPAWADVFVDRDGEVHLSAYFTANTVLDARSTMPRPLAQASRRCITWLSWVVCGDLPPTASAPISAVDRATGQPVWTFSGAASLIPQFNGPGVEFFTARLAVLNEQELLVLYESRTMDPMQGDLRVRVFAMVVLDRQGQPLRSLFIDDPLFTQRTHPHCYGVAVDAQSNIFLAFSPSGSDNPATAQVGTTLFSYSPALALRWRVFEPSLQGGELAVANGVLLHEWDIGLRSTQTGAVIASLAGRFGLGAIAERWALPLEPQVRTVQSVSTSSHALGWRAQLQGEPMGGPLTVARWDSPWGPRNVALVFTAGAGGTLLEGVEVTTGASAFVCPVSLAQPPGMVALGDGGLAVMTPADLAADPCATCDPRFARTRNVFTWVDAPGLSPAEVEWSGPWGNEGHSHHEGR